MTGQPTRSQQDTRAPDERICVGDRIMDAEGIVIRACFDPALFAERRRAGEPGEMYAEEELHRWQAHAVVVALRLAGYDLPTPDGAHVTTPRPHAVPLERFDGASCPMCGAADGDPCECHDPQGDDR